MVANDQVTEEEKENGTAQEAVEEKADAFMDEINVSEFIWIAWYLVNELADVGGGCEQ